MERSPRRPSQPERRLQSRRTFHQIVPIIESPSALQSLPYARVPRRLKARPEGHS